MIEIEKGSANIYKDLGFSDAAEMQVKATLAAKWVFRTNVTGHSGPS